MFIHPSYIEREEKQQPEPPPKYIQKHRRIRRKRGEVLAIVGSSLMPGIQIRHTAALESSLLFVKILLSFLPTMQATDS